MHLQKLIFVLLVFLPGNYCLHADTIVKTITNTDGLSNNAVNCIFQDSEEIMWFGTWDGLNAFNGRKMISFRYAKADEKTISNNIIRQIVESKSDLWISTDNSINRYNRRLQSFKRYFLGFEQKTP
jgi:ligand-binding sensor domain-containing protein